MTLSSGSFCLQAKTEPTPGLTLHCINAGSSGLSVVGSEEDVPVTDVPKGLGPRIYVGGIPNALSQTMIRNHFSHYGKVPSQP